ncbi:hypothetical protein [Halosolutus halophilus]|uniref:hypothetical protein n=1 Tax=Halosolutus halophilus TaxID=1552990 RepID=UPI002234FCCC|nr:hypothetical protein [Halosolutus halophilus]
MTALLQAVATVAVAETNGISTDVAVTDGLVGSAIGAVLTTLVVGALMIAVVPDYTDRMTSVVLEDPIDSLLYGVLSLVAVLLVTVLLVVTVVGIFVAIPLLLVAALMWAIGSAIAYLAIGERLVGRDDGWLKPLLVGAGLNGALALTGIGGLVAFAVGAAGFGAVLRTALP